MPSLEYEPTWKINVFNPKPMEKNCVFMEKLRNRIQLHKDTKLEIKNLLNSSK